MYDFLREHTNRYSDASLHMNRQELSPAPSARYRRRRCKQSPPAADRSPHRLLQENFRCRRAHNCRCSYIRRNKLASSIQIRSCREHFYIREKQIRYIGERLFVKRSLCRCCLFLSVLLSPSSQSRRKRYIYDPNSIHGDQSGFPNEFRIHYNILHGKRSYHISKPYQYADNRKFLRICYPIRHCSGLFCNRYWRYRYFFPLQLLMYRQYKSIHERCKKRRYPQSQRLFRRRYRPMP